ncbi:Pleckstrin y domain-containing A member 2, partial [Podila minutissima]
RTRKPSKAGSLPSSPLGVYVNGNSVSTLSLQGPVNKLSTGFDIKAALPPPMPELRVRHLQRGATYAGYLTKFSSRTFFSRKQWKRRYFILHQKSLHCFKSSDPQHPLLESITLCADTIVCVTDIFSGKRFCLQITCPGEKNWYVLADSAGEMSGWLKELKGTVLQFRSMHLNSRPGTHYSDSSEMSDLSISSLTMDPPSVPAIPSQYDYQPNTYGGSPSSPPPRPVHPSILASSQAMLYQGPHVSLNPPPRTLTPKPTPPTPTPGQERRRKNSTVSTQSAADYASFGTVMERAEALSPVDDESLPFPFETPVPVPRQRKGSSSTVSSHRVSIVVDRPDSIVTLPRRSSQRHMGSPSRPMSPVSSRPMSPNRPNLRSSLVVSPPPRSIHRPASVSVRHSTQIPSPLEIAAMGLASTATTLTEGSLARITSIRHTRDISTLSHYNGTTSPASLKHSSSRSSVLSANFATAPPTAALPPAPVSAPASLASSERPMSPLPDLTTAPTLPLPEPPKSPISAGTRAALSHSLSSGSTRRISIIPRHHDPDVMLTCSRSKAARFRTQSQDSPLTTIARNTTPSPRLAAVATNTHEEGPDPAMKAERASMIRSLMSSPIQKTFVLPAPPTCSQPEPPVSGHQHNHHRQSSSSSHKHSLSSSSFCSISSIGSASSNYSTPPSPSSLYPVFSQGIPMSPKKVSNRDSSLPRMSLLTLPPGSVPMPPQTALPPIPISVSVPMSSTVTPEKTCMALEVDHVCDKESTDVKEGVQEENECPRVSEAQGETDQASEAESVVLSSDEHVHAMEFEMILEEEEETEGETEDQVDLMDTVETFEDEDKSLSIDDAVERLSISESDDSTTAVDASDAVKELSRDVSENENEEEEEHKEVPLMIAELAQELTV